MWAKQISLSVFRSCCLLPYLIHSASPQLSPSMKPFRQNDGMFGHGGGSVRFVSVQINTALTIVSAFLDIFLFQFQKRARQKITITQGTSRSSGSPNCFWYLSCPSPGYGKRFLFLMPLCRDKFLQIIPCSVFKQKKRTVSDSQRLRAETRIEPLKQTKVIRAN